MEIDEKVIAELIKGYKGPEDLVGENGLLKQLTKRLLEAAMGTELSDQLGYGKHERVPAGNSANARNGSTPKKLKGDFGEIEIQTPRDRTGEFEPADRAQASAAFRRIRRQNPFDVLTTSEAGTQTLSPDK
jgi:putative transposase